MNRRMNGRLRDLVRLLDDLERMTGELHDRVQAKVDACRSGDTAAIAALVECEQALIHRLRERDGLRRQLMEQIAAEWNMPPRAARMLSLAALAARVSEPVRAQLEGAAGRMRASAMKLVRANRVAGIITREVLAHLNLVFEQVASSVRQPVGYAANGAVVSGVRDKLIDAVG